MLNKYCYSNTDQRVSFFFFSFAAARPAALFSLAAFMSFGAVVRTCLICVGIMCVERLSSTAATSEDNQLADNIGSDVRSERRPDSPGALSYIRSLVSMQYNKDERWTCINSHHGNSSQSHSLSQCEFCPLWKWNKEDWI